MASCVKTMDRLQRDGLPMAEKLARLDKVRRQLFPPREGEQLVDRSSSSSFYSNEMQQLEEEFANKYTIIRQINQKK